MDPYVDILEGINTVMEIDLSCPDCDHDAVLDTIPDVGTLCTVACGTAHFSGNREFRYLQSDIIDKNDSANHLQGVQRFGDILLFTGADWTESVAHLFVARPDANGALNVDRIIALDRERPHAGGFQRLGRLLLVPLEGKKKVTSRIVFLSIDDEGNVDFVAQPAADGTESKLMIDRGNKVTASTAAAAQLDDGRIIVGVSWPKSGFLGFSKTGFIDLYLSETHDVRRGFKPLVRCEFKTAADYQNMHFLKATPDASGGIRLHVLASRSTAQGSGNWLKGDNVLEKLEIPVAPDLIANWPLGPVPTVAVVASREFRIPRQDGNFSAAVGVDVLPDGQPVLLCGHHWRHDGSFRFTILD
jgi:hypothetical protein